MLKQLFGIGRDSMLQNDLEDKRIGYKVVARTNSRSFEPATSAALQSFRYRVDQETRREKSTSGAIAIFDTLENARHFCDSLDHETHVLLVEYEPSQEKMLWKKRPPTFVRNRWGGGYHAESNGTSEKTSNFPNGTLFAESVYVLEVIS